MTCKQQLCHVKILFVSYLLVPSQTVFSSKVKDTGTKKITVYGVRRHEGSLCTQKQPEVAFLRKQPANDLGQSVRGVQP